MQAVQDEAQYSLRDLVLAARAGDRSAFDQLIGRYRETVYRLALSRLGNEADAQDLCQDVFLRAIERLHQLMVPEAFGGWIRCITVRMSNNRFIRSGRSLSFDQEALENVEGDSETPLDVALTNERAAGVRASLARLGDLDRKTLIAFYVEGQSVARMSESFDAPVGTIKRRLHVARRRLASQLVGEAV